ncbi:PE family protein [Mycobacterium terramassiliense]|uniref:PE family protein n=1 Tax=Mycobacterium terramassiliense TaxID=1841859 RepID=A0A2U3N711_9MYCO|nr:PE family protein [Mycobacterium terramassiliense]SPM27249.1 PE family protein [Mycobacterium terramassiliense]
MSFVSVVPDLMQGAAQDLAGIRSSLAEASAVATGPTTAIAAAAEDEVSVALASLFGNVGAEFQALSAQAQAFHQEFVSLIDAGANAYLSAEVANAEQALLGDMGAPAQSLLGGGLQASAAVDAITGFGATVAAPYQALVFNTVGNLQSLGGGVTANPAPFLRQFLANQAVYGQAIATGFQSAVQNLPAELANLPATLQAGLQGALPAVQQLVNNQIGYAQLIATSLQNAGNDFVAGLTAFPANLQTGIQTIMSGDVSGGLLEVGGAFLAPIFSGLNVTIDPVSGLLDITPTGALGDLLPILGIPAQMAQNFTDLLPAGSVPRMVAQNATNLFSTVTDVSQTLDLNTGNLHIGLPLVLALDAIGPPVTTLEAIGSSATAFFGAVQTGDGLGALAALIDAPAVVANGFLNGQAAVGLPASLMGVETITAIPLGGILTPLQFASLSIPLLGPGSIMLSGTGFGGILPGLLTFLPETLAQAIGAPPLA